MIDKKRDTVVIPIDFVPVPFHLDAIKNVSKIEEGDITILRFNFVLPTKDTVSFLKDLHHLKVLSVRISDSSYAADLHKDITDHKKMMAQRIAHEELVKDLAASTTLTEIQGKKLKLGDVFLRPGLEGKRVPGDVEIHSNGIRYAQMGKSDQKIDIVFSNIKHLFFQSCKHEMIVIIHIRLQSPIMIGKKKTIDLQFYREALDSVVDETSGRRKKLRLGDEDEIVQEAEERKRRKEADTEFRSFAQKISEAVGPYVRLIF